MPLTASDVDHIGVSSKLSANMRTLHWVTKIGSLKNSLRFYELVFGFRVLRHEEFESGCEATCNGPYGGAWSKTMVGLGNENCNFGACQPTEGTRARTRRARQDPTVTTTCGEAHTA